MVTKTQAVSLYAPAPPPAMLYVYAVTALVDVIPVKSAFIPPLVFVSLEMKVPKFVSGIAVVKFTAYEPIALSVIELTLPLPRIATVPEPLKLTQARAANIPGLPDAFNAVLIFESFADNDSFALVIDASAIAAVGIELAITDAPLI